jgi:hypothetical protein
MVTASDIRAFGRENGIEVGRRGRLGPDVKRAYFAANPAAARALAAEKEIPISSKGKISEDSLTALTRAIA